MVSSQEFWKQLRLALKFHSKNKQSLRVVPLLEQKLTVIQKKDLAISPRITYHLKLPSLFHIRKDGKIFAKILVSLTFEQILLRIEIMGGGCLHVYLFDKIMST